ncbi:hypothetical protein FA95DRAFT_420600 [Auriscalpium vulgare]|uniref:Uncharacterized protein n=1 Tax=Auriscalpium vulgare TaxID=40419 RepID=A0ACB8S3M4_9AGAM|nr:hypothetical protein FA95DRAFT_420600 [Auriscalpium vulgare]
MTSVITLYDIPGTAAADGTFSANVWRARYALHIKGLAYKVIWVEYPDIASTMQKIGAAPTGTRDGQALYTCPAIHDPTTGATLSDSAKIVQYLDKQYPETPQLLPAHSRALQLAFLETFSPTRLRPPVLRLVLLNTMKQLHPESAVFFRRTREAMQGKPMEEITRKEDRAGLLQDFIDTLELLGKWKGDEVFLGGSDVSFADLLVASHLKWLRDIGDPGEGDKVVEAIKSTWGGFLKAFEKWEVIPEGTQ